MKSAVKVSPMRLGVVFASIGVMVQSGYSLAVYNNIFGLPAGLANAVVRIKSSTGAQGTGTVIDMHAVQGGDWFCVLTADHVVTGGASATIGGRFDNNYYGTQSKILQGGNTANTGLAKSIDLAVADIFVPTAQLGGLPSMLMPTFGTANTTDQAIMAGYGDQIKTVGYINPNPTPAFNVTSTFGNYLSGYNYYDSSVAAKNFGYYTEDVWQGHDREDVNGAGTVTQVYSYILSGDSGGPTFMSNGSGGLNLVGVHVVSQSKIVNGFGEVVFQGYNQWDVNTSSYMNFINKGCAQAVPEPSELGLVGLGLVGLIRRRAKK